MTRQYFFVLIFLSSFITTLNALGLVAKGDALQVVPDGTTQTSITGNLRCTANCSISGRSRSDSNLFHSFSEFSIPAGVTVTFEDGGAANIFTRVSDMASHINGALTVSGDASANFFLINPQGITFGEQGALVSSGSFIASTADYIVFSEGSIFSALDKSAPLLTMSTPVGLQFGFSPGAIINSSLVELAGALNNAQGPAGLQIRPGKTLSLIGGSVLLNSGNITANSGRIEIGSVAANSRVSLLSDFSLGYEGVSEFQDISLVGQASLDVSGQGGEMAITGRNISLVDRAAISNSTTGPSTAGKIKIIATDSVNIRGFGIFASAVPGSTGSGADLEITASMLTVAEGGLISGGTGGDGGGGNITVNASEQVEVIGTTSFSPSFIGTSTVGPGRGGNLTINTRQLSVKDGAQVDASTYGPGQGGDLIINATEQVVVSGTGQTAFVDQLASGILASSGLEGLPFQPTGDGGNLFINSGALRLDDNGQIAVNSLGRGNSGNLNVNAQRVRLDNNAQLTAAAAFGDGGNIRLSDVETLVLRRGSGISTQAGSGDGQGNGGNISIEADYIVTNLFEDSDIVAKATQGRGGDISIDTQGLYGIEERRAIANNGTNDIDASSEFGVSGTIAINQLLSENYKGLVSLSDRALESDSAVSAGCQASGNRLVVAGRGGIPTMPTDAAEISTALVDLGRRYVSPNADTIESSQADRLTNSRENFHVVNHGSGPLASGQTKEARWIEANAWHRDENNQVVLSMQANRGNRTSVQAASHCAG
ncbi:MAG: filamentous hemagglutinin N-terminal domain-containing protein [Cyanobacteria bacterium J06597_16]